MTARPRRTKRAPTRQAGARRAPATRYQLLFERNLAGVIRTRPDGRVLDCNEAAASIFGCTRSELLARLAPNLWAEPDACQRFLEQLRRDGRVTNFETQALRSDGSRVWILTSATYFAKGAGAPYIEGTLIDISERKRAEQALHDAALRSRAAAEALRSSEQRFRALVENSTDTVALVAADGTLLYVSGSIGRMLGFRADEVVGRNLLDFAHPDDLSAGANVVEEVLANPGEPIEIEVRARHRDGTWCLLACVTANHLTEPAVAAVVCNFSDVTAKRHMEQERAESGRLLRALFENAQDAIVVTDDQGRYVEANPAACQLFGASREELLGHTPERFYAVPHQYQAAHAAFLADGQSTGMLHLVTREGAPRDVEFTSTAHVLPGRHLSILRDVTEHRLLEEQFRQSQKMEAVGRLAGGIAHDFNNILSLILGYGDLLRRQIPEDTPGHNRLQEILKAAGRAADLTRQLLAFSRKQVLQPRIVDLNAVVSNLENMLRRMIGEDVTLDLELAADLGLVRADPSQLDQVLMNLAVNARDAMPQGGRLHLQTANSDLDPAWVAEHKGARGGRYVMLSMTDTGSGMSPDVRTRIFEPFFTTKAEGAGTGLGLATVYGIVRQSEGHIWVYSEPGYGTVFKIYMPRADEGEEQPPLAELPERGLRGSETVLVVEDEASLLRLTCELLEELGYRVLQAPDGAAALELLAAHPEPVHLLLTDTVMPGLNGRALAERARALRPEMRAVLMSGYTDDALARLGVSRDWVPFLQKPFTPLQLGTTLRQALDAPLPDRGESPGG